MKKLLTAVGICGGALFSHPALAQFVVADPISDPMAVETAAADTAGAASDLKTAIATGTLETMMDTATNVTSMLPGLNDLSVQNSMPAVSGTNAAMLGTSGPASASARVFYDQNNIPSTGSDALGTTLQSQQAIEANFEGEAKDNLTAAEKRALEFDDIKAQISAAPDLKATESVNGRVAEQQAEELNAINQTMNMAALNKSASDVAVLQEAQTERVERQKTALEFAAGVIP
jgi:hypothetical protein